MAADSNGVPQFSGKVKTNVL